MAYLDDYNVRGEAIFTLGKIGPSSFSALPRLKKMIEAAQKESDTHLPIAALLETYARIAGLTRAVPQLASWAAETTMTYCMRDGAINALGRLGSDARLAAPTLIHILRSETGPSSESLRQATAMALDQVGDAARPAVPVFYECLTSRSQPEPPGGWDGSFETLPSMILDLIISAP